MTPAEAIADLDGELSSFGEDITLRRISGLGSAATYTDATVRACVRAVSQQDLAAGLKMTDSIVIISPTDMDAVSWPSPPQINDKAVIQGRTRNVTFVRPFSVNGTIVRYELTVAG